MNNILKQRLVGALILVALGVVFWPIIFVEPGTKPLGEAAHIPVGPRVDTTPLTPPTKEGLRTSPELQSSQEDDAIDTPVSEPDKEISAEPVERAPVPVSPAIAKPLKKHAPRTEAPAKPAIDADGVPIAWILQIASISNPLKADELRLRLIDMGYKAYVKKIKTETTVLLRVYVGPKFERARLESIQPDIDAEFKVKSMVRRYIP